MKSSDHKNAPSEVRDRRAAVWIFSLWRLRNKSIKGAEDLIKSDRLQAWKDLKYRLAQFHTQWQIITAGKQRASVYMPQSWGSHRLTAQPRLHGTRPGGWRRTNNSKYMRWLTQVLSGAATSAVLLFRYFFFFYFLRTCLLVCFLNEAELALRRGRQALRSPFIFKNMFACLLFKWGWAGS